MSGIPSVVVAGPAFKKQAEITAYDQGVPSLRVAVYPGPFDLHSDSELRENAVKIVVPQVTEALTKPLPESASAQASLKEQTVRETVFTGTIDEVRILNYARTPAQMYDVWYGTSTAGPSSQQEQPNRAAILAAPYGRGTYIYVPLALFRQLPAGVPGGARIFANLLGGNTIR